MQGKLDEAKSQLETAFTDMQEGFGEIIPQRCELFLVDLAEIARQQNDPGSHDRPDRHSAGVFLLLIAIEAFFVKFQFYLLRKVASSASFALPSSRRNSA